MITDSNKRDILADKGYQYDFDRNIYVNKDKKKVFSENVIRDKDEKWLKSRIDEPNSEEWEFYSNQNIHQSNKDEIIKKYS